jgi:hypothetical protein
MSSCPLTFESTKEEVEECAKSGIWRLYALMHHNCPSESWWTLAPQYPTYTPSSPLYPLMVLEDPGRWKELRERMSLSWIQVTIRGLDASLQREVVGLLIQRFSVASQTVNDLIRDSLQELGQAFIDYRSSKDLLKGEDKIESTRDKLRWMISFPHYSGDKRLIEDLIIERDAQKLIEKMTVALAKHINQESLEANVAIWDRTLALAREQTNLDKPFFTPTAG